MKCISQLNVNNSLETFHVLHSLLVNSVNLGIINRFPFKTQLFVDIFNTLKGFEVVTLNESEPRSWVWMRGTHHASKLISCCLFVRFFAVWSVSSYRFLIPLFFDCSTRINHKLLVSRQASPDDLIHINIDNKELDAWNLFFNPFTFFKGITHCERKHDVFTCGDLFFQLYQEELEIRFPG